LGRGCRMRRKPAFKSLLHLSLQRRPSRSEQRSSWLHELQRSIAQLPATRACEKVQFLAGSRRGHVKQPALFLLFALTINALHPLPRLAALFAFGRKR